MESLSLSGAAILGLLGPAEAGYRTIHAHVGSPATASLGSSSTHRSVLVRPETLAQNPFEYLAGAILR
jgi:uncharacterized protein YqfA (UPF0365 family)